MSLVLKNFLNTSGMNRLPGQMSNKLMTVTSAHTFGQNRSFIAGININEHFANNKTNYCLFNVDVFKGNHILVISS